MTRPDSRDFPERCVRDLLRWLKSTKAPGVIIGGLAATLLGSPRMTYDVDALVVVDDADWPEFIRGAGPFGFHVRVSDALDFARQSRMLLMRYQRGGIDVDIMLAGIAFEREVVRRRKWKVVRRIRVPVPTPEDLVILKALAHRHRDLIDIAGILEKHPRLDKRRVRRVVSEFAAGLDAPDILHELDRLLKRHRGKKTR